MEEINLIIDGLRKSLYFKGLPDSLLKDLSSIAVIKKYAKGEEIFGEGERALGFYLILDGFVKIFKLSSKGKEQIIHLLSEGDVFAEIVLAGVEAYPAYAQALSKSKIVFFEKTRFLRLIKEKPELALNIIGMFAIKLKSLLKNIDVLTLKEARERLLVYLWELSESGKREKLTLEINKTHIALLLGITPETLSRLFQSLREEALIEVDGKEIKLTNLERWTSLLMEI